MGEVVDEAVEEARQRRLETATGASRPIPAGELEELLAEIRRYKAESQGRKGRRDD